MTESIRITKEKETGNLFVNDYLVQKPAKHGGYGRGRVKTIKAVHSLIRGNGRYLELDPATYADLMRYRKYLAYKKARFERNNKRDITQRI